MSFQPLPGGINGTLAKFKNDNVRSELSRVLDHGKEWYYQSDPPQRNAKGKIVQNGYWDKRAWGETGNYNRPPIIFKTNANSVRAVIKTFKGSIYVKRVKTTGDKRIDETSTKPHILLQLGARAIKVATTGKTGSEVKISSSTMTTMQELGSAWVFYKAGQRNSPWNSWLAMKDDDDVYDGLKKIWNNWRADIDDYDDFTENFYKQQKSLLAKLASGPSCCLWDEYSQGTNISGMKLFTGTTFMQEITKASADVGVPKKDNWNPADIWLVKEPEAQLKLIDAITKAKLPKDKKLMALNKEMREMFQRGDVFGISLKKVAENKSATTVYMNHKDEFFTSNWDGRGKGGTDNLLMEFKDAVCKFETKEAKDGGLTFKSQDARFRVWDDGNTYDFQIKANDSTKFDGLKYEPTSKGASAARLGKATVEWVLDLQRDNGVGRYFSKTNGDYPKNVDEFVENKFAKDHCSCTWKEMIRTIINGATGTSNKKLEHALTSKPGKTLEEVACDNFELVFDTEPHVANAKCQEVAWLYAFYNIDSSKRNKFCTEMCWLAMKAGRRYGPFAKIY